MHVSEGYSLQAVTIRYSKTSICLHLLSSVLQMLKGYTGGKVGVGGWASPSGVQGHGRVHKKHSLDVWENWTPVVNVGVPHASGGGGGVNNL